MMFDRDHLRNSADLLNHVTYVVDAFESVLDYQEDRLYSSGSAVAVNDGGDLITAAHVVTGSSRRIDTIQGGEVFTARTSHGKLRRYNVIKCGIRINIDRAFKSPLFVDLAYLKPAKELQGIPHVTVSRETHPAGEPVMMAGFPDELEPPLSYHRAINYSNPAFMEPGHQTAKKIRHIRQLLMIKTGIVGQSQELQTHADDPRDELLLRAFYVDNGMHSGASGGPIINRHNELIGIVQKRAMTTISHLALDDPSLDVPSGSTLGLSAYPIIDMLDR